MRGRGGGGGKEYKRMKREMRGEEGVGGETERGRGRMKDRKLRSDRRQSTCH